MITEGEKVDTFIRSGSKKLSPFVQPNNIIPSLVLNAALELKELPLSPSATV